MADRDQGRKILNCQFEVIPGSPYRSVDSNWCVCVLYSHDSFGRMSKKSGVNGKHMTR